MHHLQVLKKLLPGLIPVIVFVAADAIWGTSTGIIVAVISGLAEWIWLWARHRHSDKFVVIDTALLVVLGGISLLLENELLFKLKPGLIELILLSLTGFAAFTSFDITAMIAGRYFKNAEITPAQTQQMKKLMKIFFWVLLGHTLLVFYAAFYMSNEAWAFISGGILYVIFGIIFAQQWIMAYRRRRMESVVEWLPLVTPEGAVTGRADRADVHSGKKLLHPVVHMHIINHAGNVLLQKRPAYKLVQPGKWDTAVGGHITYGEPLETALARETMEETGLKDFSAKHVATYRWDTDLESELVYMFVALKDFKPDVKTPEVDELKFWSKADIHHHLGKSVFTPNFEHEFHLLNSAGILQNIIN